MFNICIVDCKCESKKDITEQIERFFADYDIGYEIDNMEFGSLVTPEVWRDCDYDLAIFDISDARVREELMEYSLEIRKSCPKTKIIFISSDLLCALEIFDYNPDYFIHKPQIEIRMLSAMDHLFSYEIKNRGNNLVLNTKSAKHIIPERTIVYFEHYQHSTKVICEDKAILCREKLDNLLKRLDDKLFVRCHCSFIVNLHHVREYRRTQLILSNGDVIPCSRSNQKSIREALTGINTVTI